MTKYYNGMYDRVFKAIFTKESNKDLLKKFIDTALQIDCEIINVTTSELPVDNVMEKVKIIDVIVEIKDKKVLIEINNNLDYAKFLLRNSIYLMKSYTSDLDKGKDYESLLPHIQINISKNMPNFPAVSEYGWLPKQEGVPRILDNLSMIIFNMDKMNKKWYTENKKYEFFEILNATKENIHKISEGDEYMEKYEKEVTRLNEDKDFMQKMMAQEENERLYLTAMNEARKKGYTEGIAQEKAKREEMVKSFYEQKFPIEAIEKASGLSREDILEIVGK